jgi:hypothetical protein
LPLWDLTFCEQGKALIQQRLSANSSTTPNKRRRIHEYLSFRAAVKTDARTAAAAHTDESKVRFARNPPRTKKSGKSCGRQLAALTTVDRSIAISSAGLLHFSHANAKESVSIAVSMIGFATFSASSPFCEHHDV